VHDPDRKCILLASAFLRDGRFAVLIRFRVENFRSIYQEQELSLVASPLSEREETLVRAELYQMDLLRAAAIYGANASGKSTLLAALRFMKTAVEDSHRQWNPDGGISRVPFALDPAAAKAPSLFAVDLLLDGVCLSQGTKAGVVHARDGAGTGDRLQPPAPGREPHDRGADAAQQPLSFRGCPEQPSHARSDLPMVRFGYCDYR
jgi:hypothetical protein